MPKQQWDRWVYNILINCSETANGNDVFANAVTIDTGLDIYVKFSHSAQIEQETVI